MERFVLNLLGVALVVAIAGCSANNPLMAKALLILRYMSSRVWKSVKLSQK